MPLPFILAGAAAIAAGVGAKKGYNGYQVSSLADDIVERSKQHYEKEDSLFKKQDKTTNDALEKLGALQLSIGSDFSKFDTLAKELLEKLSQHQETKDLQINIPKHKLDKIQGVAFSATAYLGQLAGSAAVGAGAAYAVYGGVMALAAASTGTPIAALSGAAAYNAAMAAIGGGSIAAGGFGMAGGAAVLGGVVAAPVALVAGWAYEKHAEKKIEQAREYQGQVDKAVKSMKIGFVHLKETEDYVNKIYKALSRIYQVFERYFQNLKNIDALVRNGIDIEPIAPQIIIAAQNGYALAAILTNIITTPLFKTKIIESEPRIFETDNDGRTNIKGNIEFETDNNGMKVINKEKIDDVIESSKNESTKFEF